MIKKICLLTILILFNYNFAFTENNFSDIGLGAMELNKMVNQTKKIVIAHRGASGYMPEHTLESYAYAYASGANFIEPDLNMTKDGFLICIHNIHLEATTDVQKKFPEKVSSDGHYYVKDFTISEIKKLNVTTHKDANGRPIYPNRFNPDYEFLKIPTFEEAIMLVKGLNRSTDKNVGIYPEMKNPAWHHKHNLDIEKATIEILSKYGYTNQKDNVYIQCFDENSLKRLSNEFQTQIKLVQLIGSEKEYSHMLTDEGLKNIAKYASGIGPNKGLIEKDSSLVARAHNNGLLVHPWTFRKEDVKEQYKSFEEELKTFYFKYNVDGLFVEQPDLAYWVLNADKLK
ncbi:MAG: glycerophosphodiester phosphodiesterase [Deferribacterota bacterium]|nr:glycerophosphodiester phosphodiesterase [Deferribacterota bacterium]